MIIKWVVGALIVAGLAYGWENRDYVTDAYEVEEDRVIVLEDRAPVDIADYIDLSKIRALEFEGAGAVAQDTRRVALPQPAGGTRVVEPLEIIGGKGKVSGTVTFNGEPVGGAEVEVERIIGDVSESVTLQANSQGRFSVDRLLGGRYRIRAWQPPRLSMRNAEVLFLPEGGDAKDLDLSLSNEANSEFTGRFNSDVARIGVNYSVIVDFRRAEVNGEGIIEDAPVAGQLVAISVRQPLRVNGSILTTSNADGVARFTVRCSETGDGRITITSQNTDKNVPVPACTDPPPPPEPTPATNPQATPNTAARNTNRTTTTAATTTTRANTGNNNSGNNNTGNNNSGNNNRNNTTTTGQSTPSTGNTSTTGATSSSTSPSTTGERTSVTRGFRFQSEPTTTVPDDSSCLQASFSSTTRLLSDEGTPCDDVRDS